MLACAISYQAAADATQMAAEVQAQCLKGLEQAEAAGTVARASILGAFTAGKGHCDNAAYIAPGVPMGERGSAASAPGRMR